MWRVPFGYFLHVGQGLDIWDRKTGYDLFLRVPAVVNNAIIDCIYRRLRQNILYILF